MFLTATHRDDNRKTLGVIVLGEKQFKSGSVGYHGQGKVEIAGKRHQVQCQAVEIGTKAKSEPERAAAVEGGAGAEG